MLTSARTTKFSGLDAGCCGGAACIIAVRLKMSPSSALRICATSSHVSTGCCANYESHRCIPDKFERVAGDECQRGAWSGIQNIHVCWMDDLDVVDDVA